MTTETKDTANAEVEGKPKKKKKIVLICCAACMAVLIALIMIPFRDNRTVSAPDFFESLPQERSVQIVAEKYSTRGGHSTRLYDTERVEEDIADDRMIAYEVELTMSVKNSEETMKAILEHVEQSKGFVVDESVTGTSCNVAVRVPSKNLDAFVHNVGLLGEVMTRNRRGKDITDQYNDDAIALENLRGVRERYQALLRAAKTVEEMLTIEKELERVIRDIDMITGRMKHARGVVAYSKVTVRFDEEKEDPVVKVVEKKTRPGPIGWIFVGLYRGIKWLFVWD